MKADGISLEAVASACRDAMLSQCVTATDAAKLYSPDVAIGSEVVVTAAREGRLIAASGTDGTLRFPMWQFAASGGALPGLSLVLDELRKSPAWSDTLPFTFFMSHQPLLGGRRPIDALIDGQREAAIRAARASRY